jgi:malate dehydrogenase
MEDVYIGVPVVLGKNGVERIVELDLEKSELDSLQASGSFYKTQLTDVLDYGA